MQTQSKVLDCSDVNRAVESLAPLFVMSAAAFSDKLLSLQVNWNHATLPAETQIHQAMGFENVEGLPVADRTKWFHGTRAKSGTEFPAGLLPTRDVLTFLSPDLWDIAKDWISKREWDDYLASLQSSDREWAKKARRKMSQKFDLGPFAFLVREAPLLQEPACQKPYQERGSELLEIVCWDFKDVFSKPLLELYLESTRPCFVVFTEPRCQPRCVRAALTYVYYRLHNLGLSLDCNTNFDGNGSPVPYSWIEKVDWLEN